MISTDFYRAFEDRYRGSRELIGQRLEAYLPFIQPLSVIYQPANAVDLGCGRGEWLELLQGAGFVPQGIDLDACMLAACTERGLPVTQGDAIAHLKSLSDQSQCIVSGFHIAEHMAFDDLATLVIHSMRVLKPGGLLILETPNPENVVVGACNFFLDPTHLRPIPPLLLSFLPEHHGFARVRTVRLQESPELRTRSDVRMMDVLGGVSPDYAVVAQKAAAPEVMAHFDTAFGAHYGIELNELADRYDGTLNRRMDALEQRLATSEGQSVGLNDALRRIASLQDRLLEVNAQFLRSETERTQLRPEAERTLQRAAAAEALALEHEQRAAAAEALALEHEQRAAAAEALALEHEQRADAAEVLAHDRHKRIDELGGSSHHWWQQACALEKERNALRQSASWRITAPLRWAGSLALHPMATARTGANQLIRHSIDTFQQPLSRLMAAVLRRPQLSHRINLWLLRYPALYQQLIGVARRGGVVPGAPVYSPSAGQGDVHASLDLANLTPHARQIYADLQTAIENNKGKR